MSNSNLGLNRKVIKVLVDSLSDSDSKIYKDIMSITGESSGEVDENDTLINYLTDGTEVTTLTSNAVKKVADDVFNGYNKLVTVNVPNATSIGVRSFQGCTSLNTVDFTSAKSLGNYAFKECFSLRNVTIPNVETIGTSSFQGCYGLHDIDLPECTEIGPSAFYRCDYIERINLPKVTVIPNSAFDTDTDNEKLLTEVNLPNVTSIGDRAFYRKNQLTEINLPKVETIGEYAFAECDIVRPNLPNVTSIGIRAFEDNAFIDVVILPKVTHISAAAFNDCYGLTTLILSNSTKVELDERVYSTFNGASMFANNDKYGIFVPDNLVDVYKADTNWAPAAENIKPLSQLPTE